MHERQGVNFLVLGDNTLASPHVAVSIMKRAGVGQHPEVTPHVSRTSNGYPYTNCYEDKTKVEGFRWLDVLRSEQPISAERVASDVRVYVFHEGIHPDADTRAIMRFGVLSGGSEHFFSTAHRGKGACILVYHSQTKPQLWGSGRPLLWRGTPCPQRRRWRAPSRLHGCRRGSARG